MRVFQLGHQGDKSAFVPIVGIHEDERIGPIKESLTKMRAVFPREAVVVLMHADAVELLPDTSL